MQDFGSSKGKGVIVIEVVNLLWRYFPHIHIQPSERTLQRRATESGI